MAEDFDWNPFKGGSGDFAKFEAIGDEVVGTITAIRVHTFDKDKGPVPLLDLEPMNGVDSVTLAIDKVDLRVKVGELEPQVGDLIAVKYINTERTPNGTKKVFAVKHKRAAPVEDPFVEDVNFPEPREEFSDDPF